MLALGMLAVSVPAVRAENPLEGKPSVLRRQLIEEGRHSLSVSLGVTLADPYAHNLLGGVAWRYYVTRWLGVGADVLVGGGVQTALTQQIDAELSTPETSFELSTTSLRFLAHATVELVPLSGKFMLFENVLGRVDFHITAGVGVALSAGTGRIEDQLSVLPVVGAGVRLLPTEAVGIGFEVRDYIVSRTLSTERDGSVPGASFGNNWLVGLSVALYLPLVPEVGP
jgi:hypothetical protein